MSNKLLLLTSNKAVIQAIEECDQLGRDAFLKKYGFGYSRLYPLEYQGRLYDSKAIAGVAFGKQHGAPLRANEFSGGVAVVIPVLKKLGFFVSTTSHPVATLNIGQTYLRKELVSLYGGQLQAGIWTPREFPVIFIFSGKNGALFGYRDGWTDEGIFQYTGEGQEGDMTFTAGNKAIKDHRELGKDILLFEDLGKGNGVRYSGLFECASWQELDGLDKAKQKRKVIIFDLVPVATALPEDTKVINSTSLSKSFEDLRKAAYEAAKAQPRTKVGNAKLRWRERSDKVRMYVLARANGICELCDNNAPFIKSDGGPYLEPHHTKRLADEGPDDPKWVGAICPNCHREIHSGVNGPQLNKKLQERLKTKESNLNH